MDEKKARTDTISDISVQDVLDELNGYIVDSEDEFNIEDILAEFSDIKSQNTSKTVLSVKKNSERAVVSPNEYEDSIKLSEHEEKRVQQINEIPADVRREKNDLSGKKTKKSPEQVEKKMVENIVRPWENGLYGDVSLEEPDRKKKTRISKLAETFDTFTRSELFEEKNSSKDAETRSVDEILADNKKISRLLGVRTFIVLLISVLSCYLTFAEPLQLYLPKCISYVSNPFRYLFLTVFFQVSAMLLSIDVISRGLARLVRMRPDADSAITFSSFATLAHAVSVMVAPHWRGWLPYSCISIVSLFFVLYAKWLRSKSILHICKVVKSSKEPSQVYVQNVGGEFTAFKCNEENTQSFLYHLNDKDASDTFWAFLAPAVIISSLAFAVLSSFGTSNPEHFFWSLAGISVVSTPFFTMLSFVLPFSVVSKNLLSIGAAISGWFSASESAHKVRFVVSDKDIFPKGTITLHGLKILGSFSLEKTICYAASVIAEAQNGLDDIFSDLLKSRYGETTKVKSIVYHESGGIEAVVGSDSVLMGSSGFMLRSGVRLNSGTNSANAVFIAINQQPAGVFNINYKPNADVEQALHMLVRKKIPVVLAVRDFNLLPTMVEKAFELKDGTLEYPEIEERIDLSSENRYVDTDSVAIIVRRGVFPFASAVLAAKKLRKATIRNICFTTAASVIGILLMFYLTFIQKPILITPHTVFAYMLLWWIPAYLLSRRVKR